MVEFFAEHWGSIVIGFGILWSAASFIVGLTPTPKDDAFLAKIAPFVSFLQPKDAPGTLKRPLSKPAE